MKDYEGEFERQDEESTALQRIDNPPPAIRQDVEMGREITPAQARVESVAAVLDSAYRNASTLKLTPEEAEQLTADFPDEAFDLGAGGDKNLIYLSHVYLRQRLNKVLGIGAVVPIRRREWSEEFTYFKDGRNKKAARVYVDLVLIVRGCVVGEAIGDAIYYMENSADSYSDTLEKAKSNAFRRCCKEFGVGLQPWMKGWCEEWKQRNQQNRSGGYQNAPRQQRGHPMDGVTRPQGMGHSQQPPAPKPAPQANVERKPATSGDVLPKVASEARRKQVDEYLVKMFGPDLVDDFSQSKGWPAMWDLKNVPASNQDLSRLVQEINDFIAARQAPPTDAPSEGSELPDEIANAIITVPRRGSKRDEYLKNPDTIGSLYRAMKDGDQDAQKRLYGLAKGWTPEPYVHPTSGKKYPVSQEDYDCRVALDLYLSWSENKGGGDDSGPSEGSMNSYDERDLNP